jgi:bifunctional non-homologous end joining protein LigD
MGGLYGSVEGAAVTVWCRKTRQTGEDGDSRSCRVGWNLVLPLVRPMPLAVRPEPFDDPDWWFEPKWDGFRALAYIDSHHCRLVSRKGNTYKSWPYLATELAHTVRCRSAVLDGEIVCLGPDGKSQFYNLLFRREWPYFMAFDLLWLDGVDLRGLKLKERKRLLASIMPPVESRVRLVEHVPACGIDFFAAACRHDLEGVVAKWKVGTYQSGPQTSWLKVRNPALLTVGEPARAVRSASR